MSTHVQFYSEQSTVTLIQRMQHSINRLGAETISALLQTVCTAPGTHCRTATACSVNALIH